MRAWDDHQLAAVKAWPIHDSHGEPGFVTARHELIVALADEVRDSRAEVARLAGDVERLTKERDELRECLSPFALYASALKNIKPHWPVMQDGNQRLTAACFYDAQEQFPELVALHPRDTAPQAPQTGEG